MKGIRFFIGTGIVLLIGAILTGVFVWYKIQTVQKTAATPQVVDEKQSVVRQNEETSITASSSLKQKASTSVPFVPKTIHVNDLSETQQKALHSFGYSGETVTITEAMMTCARDAVGNERFTEIVNGAAPSPKEAFVLLPCFKK